MITGIELENIRIFKGQGWNFHLRPMTVFCGTNSVGKSTIIKSLLLLQQSQAVRDSYGIVEGKLLLTGNRVDLGRYSSFVSNHKTEENISLSLTIEDKMPVVYYKRLLDLNSQESPYRNGQENKDDPVDYVLKSRFTFGLDRAPGKSSESSGLNALEIAEDSANSKAILKRAEYAIEVNGEKLLWWNVEKYAANEPRYVIEIPTKFYEDMFNDDLVKSEHFKKRIKTNMSVLFRVAHPGIIPYAILLQEKPYRSNISESNSVKNRQWIGTRLPPIIRDAMSNLNDALRKIDYIAPLRSSPERYYLLSSESVTIKDSTGAALPYILKDKAVYNSQVFNVPPWTNNNEAIAEPLSKALNSWLYYLRVGEKPPQDVRDREIEINTIRDLVVEIKMRSAIEDKCFSLVDSGFGYSQVLPILVQGLLAKPESMLLIEQPELHLNPALQVRLADFFVAMIRARKQILIETHSEHIVNAIRVLAAEDESGELAKKCGIFFLDNDSDRPAIHELSIQPDGTIPDLPRHFFGEAISLSGRLLRAQKKFRTGNREEGTGNR